MVTETPETLSRLRREFLEASYVACSKHPLAFMVGNCFTNDFQGHYVAFSQEHPDSIAYTPSGHTFGGENRRVRIRLARYIRRRLDHTTNQSINDSQLDAYCASVMAGRVDLLTSFEIVEGEEVRMRYESEFGGNSCMTGSEIEGLLDLYVDNLEVVSLLCFNTGSIQARAFLWVCSDGTRVMDRIYPNDGYHVSAFRRWAYENGYWCRQDNSLPDGPILFMPVDEVGSLDKSRGKPQSVTLDTTSRKWPYLDSFQYATVESINSDEGPEIYSAYRSGGNTSEGRCIHFDNTRGGITGGAWCTDCGRVEITYDMHMVHSQNVCTKCIVNYTQCVVCSSYDSPVDDFDEIKMWDSDEEVDVCPSCRTSRLFKCGVCGDHLISRRAPMAMNDAGERIRVEMCNKCIIADNSPWVLSPHRSIFVTRERERAELEGVEQAELKRAEAEAERERAEAERERAEAERAGRTGLADRASTMYFYDIGLQFAAEIVEIGLLQHPIQDRCDFYEKAIYINWLRQQLNDTANPSNPWANTSPTDVILNTIINFVVSQMIRDGRLYEHPAWSSSRF